MMLIKFIEDCHGQQSTLAESQLPQDKWHELFDDSTVEDAVLDQFAHNALKIVLKRESMRKLKSRLEK